MKLDKLQQANITQELIEHLESDRRLLEAVTCFPYEYFSGIPIWYMNFSKFKQMSLESLDEQLKEAKEEFEAL